jgi:hypothetical protein
MTTKLLLWMVVGISVVLIMLYFWSSLAII